MDGLYHFIFLIQLSFHKYRVVIEGDDLKGCVLESGSALCCRVAGFQIPFLNFYAPANDLIGNRELVAAG